MTTGRLAGVYTIPPGRGFLEDLARGLTAAYPPEDLARTRVYLPTRRACRALTEAFLALPGEAGLLPAAYPLGDVEADDLAFQPTEPALAAAEAALDLPPAVSPLRRRFLLARFVQAKQGADMPLAAALRLAEALARFLDEMAIERVDPQKIRDLDPGGFAGHWAEVLKFLEIVLERWPELLAAEGRMDPAARREALLDAQAAAWTAAPPDAPLIVAGSTGALPSTRALMQAALTAPLGAVVLPGFDRDRPESVLAAAGHPQHAMATALDDMKIPPDRVQLWPGADSEVGRDRRAFATAALTPAKALAGWAELPRGAFSQAAKGMIRIDAENEDMEARAIAVFLRKHLDRPDARTALATPDRGLARRVAAELRRWNIEADDSAGRPLGETPVGAYLRLVARAFRPGAGAVDRLSLLKHPLAAGGMARARFRRRARALELTAWRSEGLQRRTRSFEATAATLEASTETRRRALAPFARRLVDLGAPLLDIEGGTHPFADLLNAHIEVAEAFAATDAASGAETLWRGTDGEAAADLLADALEAADAAPALDASDYADAFDAILADAAVRPPASATAGVAILGVLEARLASFDAVALAGLDEGLWPRPPAADPWFSRTMREEVGLSDPDRRTGLSAHDFWQHLATPHVLLSRSRRRDGAPTKPSRWLERLDAVLAATGDPGLGARREADAIAGWAGTLDPDLPPFEIPDPAPRPPLAARPRRLSVTRVKLLRDDPYAVYARYILGLRSLAALDPPPGVADRGRIVHRIFERFYADWPESLPEDIAAALGAIAAEEFREIADAPAIQAFWRPAFDRAARWAAEVEPARRADLAIARVEAEMLGEASFDAPGGRFVVDARADRIDLLAGGALAIVDVKTGAEPSVKELLTAKEPQMPLEAAIARHGGFGTHQGRPVAELAIWRVGGQSLPKTVALEAAQVEQARDAAWDGLQRLIAGFDDLTTPYLSEPRGISGYSDYRGLARRSEDVEERA